MKKAKINIAVFMFIFSTLRCILNDWFVLNQREPNLKTLRALKFMRCVSVQVLTPFLAILFYSVRILFGKDENLKRKKIDLLDSTKFVCIFLEVATSIQFVQIFWDEGIQPAWNNNRTKSLHSTKNKNYVFLFKGKNNKKAIKSNPSIIT